MIELETLNLRDNQSFEFCVFNGYLCLSCYVPDCDFYDHAVATLRIDEIDKLINRLTEAKKILEQGNETN